jgi:cyclopropane-fatty-acyl-phospholipid synthase
MNEIAKRGADHTHAGFGAFDRFLRQRLIAQMARLRHGRLVLRDALGTVELGEAAHVDCDLDIRIDVHNAGFYRAIAANGSVGAGESYMDDQWRCNDLVALVRLLVRNRDLLDGMETGLARLGGIAMRAWHTLRRNTRTGSRRNIAAHYDLGNEFFQLFLSPDLMYSSGIWAGDCSAPDGDNLDTASTRKLDRICRKLDLKPGDDVIEIGTGWGGFALHAARHYGCSVTTTTISREQHALAAQRVAEAGLQDRVTLLLEDYRDLGGSYDKLVSIEMIEAIGAQYLDTYFGKLGSLLKPDGLALVQAITIEDHRYEQALNSVDFIKRHVFPGSFIPSIAAMVAAKGRASDLALIQLEDFGLSYARTLEAWRQRFHAALPQVRAQGFDERFIAMWEFYLAYCEGGFRERSIGVAQLLMAKPGHRRPAPMPELAQDAPPRSELPRRLSGRLVQRGHRRGTRTMVAGRACGSCLRAVAAVHFIAASRRTAADAGRHRLRHAARRRPRAVRARPLRSRRTGTARRRAAVDRLAVGRVLAHPAALDDIPAEPPGNRRSVRRDRRAAGVSWSGARLAGHRFRRTALDGTAGAGDRLGFGDPAAVHARRTLVATSPETTERMMNLPCFPEARAFTVPRSDQR